jgi:hypothetical protein
MRCSARYLLAGLILIASAFATSTPLRAAIIPFDFDAVLLEGPLAGAHFDGTGAYDNAGAIGIGLEFQPLTSLDFILLGVEFTRLDIKQGGQFELLGGMPFNFTAAFFPPPPENTPVTDIAFGFGGPGIIGYAVGRPGVFGSGLFVIETHETAIPEPRSLALLSISLIVVTIASRFSWVRRRGTKNLA